jgi:tetratricopeptide (TPR) repeat protein
MAISPKLFVSFSSKDQKEVRELFANLESQNIHVWDYSNYGQELPLAQRVDAALAERIDSCEYFIAVVSANSVDEDTGRYTHFEVQYAIKTGMVLQHRILPVLIVNNPPKTWGRAYKELETLLRIEINFNHQTSLEPAIRRICDYLKRPYIPPFLGNSRVFFSQSFLQEMERLDLSNAAYSKRMQIMNDCAEKVLHGEWAEAKRLASLFLMLCSYENPEVQFYYPQIIKGVCQLQLKEFGEAEQTFLQATRHPARDENSFGGLGHAYFCQQHYDEALSAFQQALELHPKDKDIEFNILGTLNQIGEAITDESFLDRFDLNELSLQDYTKVVKMRGIINLRKGNYAAVIKDFKLLDERGLLDAASVIYYYRALAVSGRFAEGVRLLRSEAVRLDDLNLYHHLADAYWNVGGINEALEIYRGKLCQPKNWTRQYLIEYARILRVLGNSKDMQEMRKICAQILDQTNFPNSTLTKADFYYMGFANYLLGNHERAQYDYDRSSRYFNKYYDELEL